MYETINDRRRGLPNKTRIFEVIRFRFGLYIIVYPFLFVCFFFFLLLLMDTDKNIRPLRNFPGINSQRSHFQDIYDFIEQKTSGVFTRFYSYNPIGKLYLPVRAVPFPPSPPPPPPPSARYYIYNRQYILSYYFILFCPYRIKFPGRLYRYIVMQSLIFATIRKHKRVTKTDVSKNVPEMKYAIAFNNNESYIIIYTSNDFTVPLL